MNAALAFARRTGGQSAEIPLDAYFYTDSSDDLPLLEAVTRPVTANAKPALAQLAAARGWPQLEFQTAGELAA